MHISINYIFQISFFFFFQKPNETRNYNGFYSAYNCDNYEEYDDENEQRDDFEESYQYSESFNIDKSDNNELKNIENCDNSKVKYNENNKNLQEISRTSVNQISKYEENASEFESFWTLHGDTICLNSWIEKYKDHVCPEFLEKFKQCDNFQEIANTDVWSSSINQSIMQHDSSCTDQITNSETFQDSCADGIILNGSSDNCDSALKNMNDKFESMSFSDRQTELISDGNVKCDSENAESREVDLSLDSYELYSESMLPYTNADFEKVESIFDLPEKRAESSDSGEYELFLPDELSDMAASSNSLNECDINSNELSTSEDKISDEDFAFLKENCAEVVSVKQTQNPLFICTKSDDEYEAEIKSRTWEELWFAHCQEEFDKCSAFFSENSTKLSKNSENDFSKCKYCGEINCLVCNSEYKNGDDYLKVSDFFSKVMHNSHSKSDMFGPNKLMAYSVIDNYISKDTSVLGEGYISENKLNDPFQMNKEGCSDDEGPMELPIKRL